MIKGITLYKKRKPYLFSGPVFFDSASSSAYQAALSTYSWSHTCTGTNRGLIVGVSILATGTVTSITYNLVNMTFVRADANGVYRNEMWRLENPASGTNTVTVNLSASLTSIANASSWTGVSQTNMVEAENGANGSGTDATVSVTTISASTYVVANVSAQDTAITSVSPLRSRINNTGALGTGALGDSILKWVAGAVTTTWTDVAALQSWGIGAVALGPFTAAVATKIKDMILPFGVIVRKR